MLVVEKVSGEDRIEILNRHPDGRFVARVKNGPLVLFIPSGAPGSALGVEITEAELEAINREWEVSSYAWN